MGQSTAEVKHDIETTRNEMSDTIDAIADRTSPSRMAQRQRRRVADGVRSVRERVMGAAEQAVGSTQDTLHSAQESTGDLAGKVTDVPDRARQAARRQTQGNPLAAGVVAFGAGLLAAYLVPSSAPERRVTRQVREGAQPVLDELSDAGREVADDLRSNAGRAAEDVKQTATEATQQLAQDAKGRADEIRHEAEDRTDTVRDEAQGRTDTAHQDSTP
jgi:gas vesicle protein